MRHACRRRPQCKAASHAMAEAPPRPRNLREQMAHSAKRPASRANEIDTQYTFRSAILPAIDPDDGSIQGAAPAD